MESHVISKELQLIIDCIEDKTIPEGTIDASFDHHTFFNLTETHRMIGKVYAVMGNLEAPVLQPTLHSLYATNKMTQLKLAGELILLTKQFDQLGVDFVSFKGPVLSEQIYGDPSERTSRDLDILVKEEQLDTIIEHMQKMGYFISPKYNSPKQYATIITYFAHFEFYHPEKDITVEIHWKFSPLYNLQLDSIWKNTRITQFAGHPIHTLSELDQALYLCIHGARHCYFRLQWLSDIYHVFAQKDEAFIEELLVHATTHCQLVTVLTSFRLLEAMTHLSFDAVKNHPQYASQSVNKLVSLCMECIVQNTTIDRATSRSARWQRLRLNHRVNFITGGFKGLVKSLIKRNVRPSNWETFAFPDSVFFLNHWCSRIIWLFTKH